ncbi:MAG: hypothetical protein V4437_02590 [Patescibacteria group bacterium]
MKNLTKVFLALALIIIFLVPAFSYAATDATSELHITADGTVSAKNLYVMQKPGNTAMYARAKWGQTFIRVTVFLSPTTSLMRNHGGTLSAFDIGEGDLLNVEGTIAIGAEDVVINAKKVRDMSLETEPKTFAGTISSVNLGASSFMLKSPALGNTTVTISTSTLIRKGVRTIMFSEIAVGDKVLSASGLYDFKTKTLNATSTEIFQTKTTFILRDFKGTLTAISGSALPTILSVTVGNIPYTVYLNEKSLLLSKSKTPAELTRFVVGDAVRFHGAIRQTNLREVDADSISDLNF